MEKSPLEVADFSGGITDHYLNGDLRKCQAADNFLLTPTLPSKLFTRAGSDIYDIAFPQIPVGVQRIGALIDHEDLFFIQSARKLYYFNSGYTTLQGPSGNDVFNTGTTAESVAWAKWNKHLLVTHDAFPSPAKIYKESGTWKVVNAGLPKIQSAPTVTPNVVGGNTYLYRFLYFREYSVGDLTYQDFGATFEVSVTRTTAIDGTNPSAISGIPQIAAGTENYDTANMKVLIYRTTDGGTTFYKVGQVNNGTTVFNDTVTDAALILNEELYTTGGVLDNDPPPLCKYVHVVGNVALYAHVKELVGLSYETKANRFRQSVPDDFDSCPETLFTDLEDEITGVSSFNGYGIILCSNYIYRIDGFYDELGRGTSIPQRISEVAGCVSHRSIVQTQKGIFWAGNDGFYYSNGYDVLKISRHLNDTYKGFLAAGTAKNITGRYDGLNRRIYWTIQRDSASFDNDACIVLDLTKSDGITEEATFTTWSGKSFAPTDICFFQKRMLRADKRGYVFEHKDSLFSDPKIDVTVGASTWTRETLIYSYKSCATNFGSSYLRKFVTKIGLVLQDRTNASVQIYSINDDGRSRKPLAPIRFRGIVTWGDVDCTWGDPSVTWNLAGLIDQLRRFPAKGLRCEYKQVEFTNAFVPITNSDTLGLASVNAMTKQAVLLSGTSVWPALSVDYYIAFEQDSYVTEYRIVSRTDSTVTFEDVGDTAPSSVGIAWVIRGYPKDEALDIVSYCIHFAQSEDTQDSYTKAGSGENA